MLLLLMTPRCGAELGGYKRHHNAAASARRCRGCWGTLINQIGGGLDVRHLEPAILLGAGTLIGWLGRLPPRDATGIALSQRPLVSWRTGRARPDEPG